MKYTLIFILATFLITPMVTAAQKQSKKEQRITKKAEKKRKEQTAHNKAIHALDARKWAFEVDELYDKHENKLEIVHRSNVIGSSGKKLVVFFNYNFEEENHQEKKWGDIKTIKKEVKKNGNIIYEISVNHPFAAELIIEVFKGTNLATARLHIGTTSITTFHYKGRILPANESTSYYVIKVE